MQTLARAVQKPDAIGERLRLPWWKLQADVTLSTKELLIIAGAAGGGKSTVAVNLIMQTDYSALYFAQDSGPSVLSRMAALALGVSTDAAREMMASEGGRRRLGEELLEVRPTLVVDRGAQTIEEISEKIKALVEWLGESPRLVVIDNLIDLKVPGHQHTDTAFYGFALPRLKQLAIELDVAMVVLHHAIRRTSDGKEVGAGGVPLKMTDLLYAGDREARHVWGVFNDMETRMTVQILKQQDGPADRDGKLRVPLTWLPEMGKVSSR